MIRLRNLWASWLRALGLRPRRRFAVPTGATLVRLTRGRGRLDARGLQRMLDDAYAPAAPRPAEVEEPPRKAVGS